MAGPDFLVGSGFASALVGGAGRGAGAAEGVVGRTNRVCFADVGLADAAGFAGEDELGSDDDLACSEDLAGSDGVGGTVGLTSPLAETGVLNFSEIIGRRGGEVIHLSVIAASRGWRHLFCGGFIIGVQYNPNMTLRQRLKATHTKRHRSKSKLCENKGLTTLTASECLCRILLRRPRRSPSFQRWPDKPYLDSKSGRAVCPAQHVSQ